MALERRVGFHSVDGTVEVPIGLMNVSYLPLRSIDEGSELQFLDASAAYERGGGSPLEVGDTLISHNHINAGHGYQLGLSVTMGPRRCPGALGGRIQG